MERFEDVGLAGAVAAHQSRDAGDQLAFRAGVAPEVLEKQFGYTHFVSSLTGLGRGRQSRPGRTRSARDPQRHHHVEVAVVADDPNDTWSERSAELERDLGRGEASEGGGHEARVERDGRGLALDRGLEAPGGV